MRIITVLLVIGGLTEALLLSRLTLRLLAARPDNPVFAAFFALTAPLTAVLSVLDVGQPRFGAVLELSTLVLCVVLAVIMLLLVLLDRHRVTGRVVR